MELSKDQKRDELILGKRRGTKGFNRQKEDKNRNKDNEPVSQFWNEGNPNTGPIEPSSRESQKEDADAISQQGQRPQKYSTDTVQPASWGNPGSSQTSIGPAPDQESEGNVHENKEETSFKDDSVLMPIKGESNLSREIKDAITKEPSLALVVENIRIIDQHGNVILEREVSSEQQKTLIGDKATALVGDGLVNNYLKVTYGQM